MLERNKPQLLSIWEVATRLHEIDPETATVETLSVEAKETLRNLIIAQGHHFNIFDIDGEQLLPIYIPIVKIVKEHPVALRLTRMGKDRKFDKEFLDGVYIDKEEYEYLMLMHNEPIPTFWFSAHDIEYHNEQRLEAHGRLPKQEATPPSEKPKSERHAKAAQIKHAPKIA